MEWVDNFMSATNGFETDLLALIFNGTTIANIADNTGTSPATNLYVSLHTADPTDSGDQESSEAAYTSYSRVSVARNSGGWTISGDTASNTAAITFPKCTGGSSTVTHFGIGLNSTGSGTLLFSGSLDNSLAITNGITPSFLIGELEVSAD